MKTTIFALLLLSVPFTSHAAGKLLSSRGYVYLNSRDKAFYGGLMDDGTDVGFEMDYARQSMGLTDEQYRAMAVCSKKKETHAILVTTVEVKSRGLTPEGEFIDSSESKIKSVDCVKAPGFLTHWRAVLNMRAN